MSSVQENFDLRHLTIQQLHRATRRHKDALFRICGKEFTRALIVGNVCTRRESENHISYDIDDGTGTMQARLWRDSSQELECPLGDIGDLAYVRAIGKLDEYRPPGATGPVRSFSLEAIQHLEDKYEVYYHSLKVISDSLSICYGPPPPIPTHPQQSNPDLPAVEHRDLEDAGVAEITNDFADTCLKTPVKSRNIRSILPPTSPTPHSGEYFPVHASSSGSGSAGTSRHQVTPRKDDIPQPVAQQTQREHKSISDDPYKDLNTLQRAVLLAISDHNSGVYPSIYPNVSSHSYEGTHRDHIIRQVVRQRKEWSSDMVHHAVSELIDQGYIYPTVDNDHFGVIYD